MQYPLVSVIMPVKNGEAFLNESIQSIMEQDYPAIEIIVVDGQSTDSTRMIAESYKKVRYYYQDENPGIPHAKNMGIEMARGDFISFASHDDLWAKNKLSSQLNYMNRHNVDYTITKVKFFLQPGSDIRPGFNKNLLEGDYVGKMPETLVARRTVFDRIGTFNTEFTYMEDIDWFNRASLNNIPMGVVEEVLLFKRIHDNNVSYDSRKINKINREILFLLKKSIDRNSHLNQESSK